MFNCVDSLAELWQNMSVEWRCVLLNCMSYACVFLWHCPAQAYVIPACTLRELDEATPKAYCRQLISSWRQNRGILDSSVWSDVTIIVVINFINVLIWVIDAWRVLHPGMLTEDKEDAAAAGPTWIRPPCRRENGQAAPTALWHAGILVQNACGCTNWQIGYRGKHCPAFTSMCRTVFITHMHAFWNCHDSKDKSELSRRAGWNWHVNR